MRQVRLWIKMAAFMVFAIVLGFVLIVCAYMLPRTRMKGHVAQSDEVFNYEGIFPQVMAGMKSSQLDNYTDAIMLSTAIVPSSGNIWKDALQNIRYEYDDTDMVQGLNDYANDVEEQKPYRYELSYSRYWHGYLIILKPLLLFLNVSEIRMLNMIMQGILLLSLFYLVQRRLGAVYIMPLFMAVMVLNPVVLPLSLQFSWVWYICLICSIVIMCTDRIPGDEWYLFVFLGTGALTSYFDLLTYPLITLGIPLLLFLIKWKSLKVQTKVLYILQLAMTWGIGYAVMWFGKWLWFFVLGQGNLYQNVYNEIMKWISRDHNLEEHLTYGGVMGRIFSVILNWPYLFMFSLFVFVCLGYKFWVGRKNTSKACLKKIWLMDMIPYMIVAVIPFIWYFILLNHTWMHFWFSYRALGMTVFALGTAMIDLCWGTKGKKDSSVDDGSESDLRSVLPQIPKV